MSEEFHPIAVIPRGGQAPVLPSAKFTDIGQQCLNAFLKMFESLQSITDENKKRGPGERWNLYLTGETANGPFLISPKTGNDWGYTSVQRGAERELSLENERLKTQLMAEKRAVLQERRRYSDLYEQTEKLWECVSDLGKQNQSLVCALAGRAGEKLCFSETHKGVVTEVREGEVTVSYTTPDGNCIKQVYQDSQFMKNRGPDVGDVIEANVIITTAPKGEPKAVNEAALARAFRGFEKGKVGKHIL